MLHKDDALIGTSSDGANHQYDLSAFWTALGEDKLPSVTYLKAAAYQMRIPATRTPSTSRHSWWVSSTPCKTVPSGERHRDHHRLR